MKIFRFIHSTETPHTQEISATMLDGDTSPEGNHAWRSLSDAAAAEATATN